MTSDRCNWLRTLYNAVFLPRDAMHKCGLCRHAVCVSVTILRLYLAWLPVLTLQQAGVVNAVASGARPACRKLRHIAGSKRRCWLPEKTTKCLWQEASTLRQRQQNSAFNCTQICASTRRFVMLKLTTDRLEGRSRLLATAQFNRLHLLSISIL